VGEVLFVDEVAGLETAEEAAVRWKQDVQDFARAMETEAEQLVDAILEGASQHYHALVPDLSMLSDHERRTGPTLTVYYALLSQWKARIGAARLELADAALALRHAEGHARKRAIQQAAAEGLPRSDSKLIDGMVLDDPEVQAALARQKKIQQALLYLEEQAGRTMAWIRGLEAKRDLLFGIQRRGNELIQGSRFEEL
jgi:hypothetical protein